MNVVWDQDSSIWTSESSRSLRTNFPLKIPCVINRTVSWIGLPYDFQIWLNFKKVHLVIFRDTLVIFDRSLGKINSITVRNPNYIKS